MNNGERFALGQCHFNDGEDAKALEYLTAVFKENPEIQRERTRPHVALDLHQTRSSTTPARSSRCSRSCANAIPTLEIPFDKILVVGKAYHGHRRTRTRVAGLSRRHQRQLRQRLRHQRRARGRGPFPRLDRFPGTRLARIPGHRRGGLRLFRALAVALSESAEGPRAAQGGQRAAGKNRHAQAHRGHAGVVPRPLSDRPAGRRRRLQPVQRHARPQGLPARRGSQPRVRQTPCRQRAGARASNT